MSRTTLFWKISDALKGGTHCLENAALAVVVVHCGETLSSPVPAVELLRFFTSSVGEPVENKLCAFEFFKKVWGDAISCAKGYGGVRLQEGCLRWWA